MERFVKRHNDRIMGILSGFDRVLFRGTLRSISYREGLDRFLSSQRVLYKDFVGFAERLSERIKRNAEALAGRQGRPFQYVGSSRVSKEQMARQILQRDGITQGLICVLSCVESCRTFSVRKDAESKRLVLVSQERKCLHLYFYYLDREFGLMHVRLQTWLPFPIQVCINGRYWLARQMNRRGLAHQQSHNCFTWIEDLTCAQRLLDSLNQRKWVRLLQAWAAPLNPWVGAKTGLSLHPYYWSIRESEYATDVMFTDRSSLAPIYASLARHAIEYFGAQDIMRFLGKRANTQFQGEVCSDLRKRIEGIRIKHWVDENSMKMYDKGSVLRIETTINNPQRFKVRRRTTRKGQTHLGLVSDAQGRCRYQQARRNLSRR